ncbi:penicillin-binding protein 1A [Massilia sp. HP4]|uniref:penicillin-binding protein 1A n=1 Tax=Massilia sp. HP4 TaxID=2562316 RepID=UPI001E5DE873|nr:PBP1A family penicillin-binding protein [Massilia sp. HP4]
MSTFPVLPTRAALVLSASALLPLIAVPHGAAASILPEVPDIKAVTDYRPKIPLRVYTADKVLIGEFGAERREFVPIAKVPALMKSAVLAIEDTRFYEHGGVDWIRALGAAKANIGDFGSQGASTITMQVARNFFLSRDKTLPRKLTEVALAYKIEKALTKDQILEVYLNQIYLGQRAYGFASAARTYFGKPLAGLSLAEIAMLAGLPQNPSSSNPVSNPQAARKRQHVVLRRMRELAMISEPQYRRALAEPLQVRSHGASFNPRAAWVAEIARQAVHARLGQAAYERGITVTTTIVAAEQDAAHESVRRNVLAYDRRHGYRGPETRIALPAGAAEREDAIATALHKRPAVDGLAPAVVTAASGKRVRALLANGEEVEITGPGLAFAAGALSAKTRPALKLAPGAVIRVTRPAGGAWAIAQLPEVAAAFVALDTDTGAYRALVGGFDYSLHKFNHVTQAWRQPGSSIKPFVYSAGLERGFFPGTQILDEPLDFSAEKAYANWSPRNDDNVFEGPVTVRHALSRSRNVPTVRMLRALDVDYAREHLARFGFNAARQPRNLTLGLGTGAVTPLQMAGAYAVLANGGYRVEPWLIARIEDGDGKVLHEQLAPQPRQEAARVLDERNAFIVDSMLRDVTRVGTATAASRQLQRQDLAGKTGTTSNAVDGWFAGYGGQVAAVAWMGYDEPRSLGGREFGSTLALPMWVDFMRVALAKTPQHEPLPPEGVARAGGDWVYAEYAEQERAPEPVDGLETLIGTLSADDERMLP